jgi:5-methylcytosine-specific restriction enzyme A
MVATGAPINIGEVIHNDRLREVFKCSTQGGMRRSLDTNTLVLVSNHVKSVYGDRWIGDTLHYTGMGLIGDQSLNASQNKTLNESNSNGVGVHLFEVFVDKEYTYQGQVHLAVDPYQERQPDSEGDIRDVWVFPLKLIDGVPLAQSAEDFRKTQVTRERKARRLSDSELEDKAVNAPKVPGSRTTKSTQYERDPHIAEFARRRASGVCDLCERPAPFQKKNGDPYLESHHIVWLSKGGEDTTSNTVALCPNCHRRMHIVKSVTDIKKLRGKVAIDE